MNKIKLNEIATIIMGQSPKSSAYNNNGIGIPFMQGKTTFGRIYPYIDTWTTEWNKTAIPNDILFTVRAPVGDVNISNDTIAIGRGLAVIRSNKVNYKYLYYLLSTNKMIFSNLSTGTIYESINKDKIENTELLIHDSSIQQHIVDTIEKEMIFNEIMWISHN